MNGDSQESVQPPSTESSGVASEPAAATVCAEDARPEPPGRTDYLRWSCDHLAGMLDQERMRRANARRDAHATMLFLLVPLGFYFTTIKEAEPGVVEITVLVLLLVTVLAAVICWFMAMKVAAFPVLTEAVFTQHDNTVAEHEYADRYLKTRDRLLEDVQKAKQLGTELVAARGRCLNATVIGVALALVLFLLRIQVMTAGSHEKPVTTPPRQQEAVPTKPPPKPQPTAPLEIQGSRGTDLRPREPGPGGASQPTK